MIDHSEEVFVHRIKEVKYIESNYCTLRDSCVAYSEQMEQFADMVNAAIEDGWEPIGTPIYAGRDDEVPDLIQMMVKR